MTELKKIKTWRERIGAGEDFPLHAPTDVETAMVAEIAELRGRLAQTQPAAAPTLASAPQVERAAVSEGWQLVPVAPTDEMFVAFAETWFSKARPIDDCGMGDCYAAMLAAAPAAPVAQEGEQSANAFDFRAHLARQAAFSLQTFGHGMRTKGVCDHIRKELLEIEADPTDLGEWVDVVILGLDGAWRCGGTPEQIIAGIVAKQTKNEGRNWPDWRTADPDKAIEHDRSTESASAQAAPTESVDTPELRKLAAAYRGAGLSRLREPYFALIAHIEPLIAARVAQALEQAAKVCEQQADEPECPERAQYCADAIRALRTQPPADSQNGAAHE